MSAVVLVLIGVAAGWCLAAHLGLALPIYLPVRLRRLRPSWRRGVNGPTMVAWRENGLGVDPEAAYFYAPFEVALDEALVIRGRLAPAPYASLTLYDLHLQGSAGRAGPTHLNHHDLGVGDDGAFEVVLAHDDRGWRRWLDLGGRPGGVVAWRQAEGAIEPPRLEKMSVAAAVVGRTDRPPPGSRLTGPWTWPVVRALYVTWMTVRTLTRHDWIHTLAAGQDAADFERFEVLGGRLDLDPTGRGLRLAGQATPGFDTDLPYPEESLGAHLREHFAGPAQNTALAPSGYPLSDRGTWARDRWRHLHDLRHVLLGLGTTLPEEVVLHGFQFGQHPTWSGAMIMAIGSVLGLRDGVPPWRSLAAARVAFHHGRRARLVVAEPVETWATRPIDEVRDSLGVVPLGQRYGARGPFPPPAQRP